MLIKAALAGLAALAATQGVVVAVQDAAGSPQWLNVALNFASLVILVGGVVMAPRAFRAKSLQAALGEKDQVIATHEQLAEVQGKKVEQLEVRLRDMGFELDAAQRDHALWRGRYEEQQKYTAQPALEAIQGLLELTNEQAERRHTEMLTALEKIPRRAGD